MLWILGFRKEKRFYVTSVIQALIWVVYYAQTPQEYYYFKPECQPHNLFFANFSAERLLVFLIFIGGFVYVWSQARWKKWPDDFYAPLLRAWPLALFCIAMFVFTAIGMFKFSTMKSGGPPYFEVSNRYFMYLTPLSIASISLMPSAIISALGRNRLLKVAFIILLGALLFYRLQRTFLNAFDFSQGWI